MASPMQIDRLLETTVRLNASDLLLSVGRPARLRLAGRLCDLPTTTLNPSDTVAMTRQIMPPRVRSAGAGLGLLRLRLQRRAFFRGRIRGQ